MCWKKRPEFGKTIYPQLWENGQKCPQPNREQFPELGSPGILSRWLSPLDSGNNPKNAPEPRKMPKTRPPMGILAMQFCFGTVRNLWNRHRKLICSPPRQRHARLRISGHGLSMAVAKAISARAALARGFAKLRKGPDT